MADASNTLAKLLRMWGYDAAAFDQGEAVDLALLQELLAQVVGPRESRRTPEPDSDGPRWRRLE